MTMTSLGFSWMMSLKRGSRGAARGVDVVGGADEAGMTSPRYVILHSCCLSPISPSGIPNSPSLLHSLDE